MGDKIQIRDEKGLISNKDWRLESNIKKKIINPTTALTSC
jgi:hypothetical protein